MAQKPKIEYVGQFYIVGSEAAKLKQKKNPAVLTTNMVQRTVYIDPVALAGIVLAVVLLIGLAVGCLQYRSAWKENDRVHAAVSALRSENTALRQRYTDGFDVESIRDKAKDLGMVPAEEAEVRFMDVTMPKPKKGPSWWSEVKWFLSGLLERD